MNPTVGAGPDPGIFFSGSFSDSPVGASAGVTVATGAASGNQGAGAFSFNNPAIWVLVIVGIVIWARS